MHLPLFDYLPKFTVIYTHSDFPFIHIMPDNIGSVMFFFLQS